MANWCINQITIKGEKLHLTKLKGKINDYINLSKTGNKLWFMEYLIGLGEVPEDYTLNPGEFNTRWFGTTCDLVMDDLKFDIGKNYIFIDAESHWYPIIPFVSKLCKKYSVTSTFDYFEPQNDFGGRTIIDESGFLKNEDWPYLIALFLYRNKAFWQEQEYYKENITIDDLEELVQNQALLSKNEKEKLLLQLNMKKYNL